MKASILAIGTELTTGQIINRNASRISDKLQRAGLHVAFHLCTPDHRDLINKALHFIEAESDLIFITGGLGPTSDDFTREEVSRWSGLSLEYNEETWGHITERLTSRGFKARDMQKQQCYFPTGAEILFNREGTAHAFKIKVRGKTVYTLPGPPREIEAVWQDHIEQDIQTLTAHINKKVTRAWDTIGVGESEVAFQVEELIKKFPGGSPLEVGYRVHLPYVEVKLTYDEQQQAAFKPLVEQVTSGLKAITVTRDFQDVASLCIEKIKKTDFTFYDFVSEGFLHSRLSPHTKQLNNWSFKQSAQVPGADWFEHEDNFLALLPYETDKILCLSSLNGQRKQQLIEAPMKSELMQERRKQYFAELALVQLISD